MITEISNQTDLESSDIENSHSFDFTANRKEIKESFSVDFDQIEIIEEVKKDLDDWELTVFNAFMESPVNDINWKRKLADSTINPATGRAYSRPSPQNALDRIKSKFLKKFGKAA